MQFVALLGEVADGDDLINQIIGAGLTMGGAFVTVLGLNAMKVYTIRHDCSPLQMPKGQGFRWFGSFCLWGVGQGIMLGGLTFATASVCAAVANFAVVSTAAPRHT
jgi:hypothetical protein